MYKTFSELQKLIFLICMGTSLMGCATAQKSREVITIAGFAAGALIGAATAPQNESQSMHSLYWAGIAGTGSALVANHIYNDESEKEKLKIETDKLKAELDLIQTGKMVLTKSGTGTPEGLHQNKDGKKVQWKMFKVDQWVPADHNKIYHQDLLIEVTPQ